MHTCIPGGGLIPHPCPLHYLPTHLLPSLSFAEPVCVLLDVQEILQAS